MFLLLCISQAMFSSLHLQEPDAQGLEHGFLHSLATLLPACQLTYKLVNPYNKPMLRIHDEIT